MADLQPFAQGQKFVLEDGTLTIAAAVYFQEFIKGLNATLTNIEDLLAQIIAAQATADTAQEVAVDTARESARINSYPNPGSILSAADVGTDVTITIDAHERVYPVQGSVDIPDVAIAGGSVTGLPFSTRYYLYYDDVTLTDPAPTFIATTDSAEAQVGAAAGRHSLGFVDTPADGAAPSSGSGSGPPGGSGGDEGYIE